jgi:hypothetical protein
MRRIALSYERMAAATERFIRRFRIDVLDPEPAVEKAA